MRAALDHAITLALFAHLIALFTHELKVAVLTSALLIGGIATSELLYGGPITAFIHGLLEK